MNNIIFYLNEYGKYGFEEKPFNESGIIIPKPSPISSPSFCAVSTTVSTAVSNFYFKFSIN